MATQSLEVSFMNNVRKPMTFSSGKDALLWVEKLEAAFAWLTPLKPQQTAHDFNANFAQQIKSSIQTLKTHAERWSKDETSELRAAFESTLKGAVDSHRIPFADDPVTALAQKLAAEGDNVAAISALAADSNRIYIPGGNAIPSSVWAGIVAANGLRYGYIVANRSHRNFLDRPSSRASVFKRSTSIR